nr:hypothetical protein [Tanacetum cinerariifolium]
MAEENVPAPTQTDYQLVHNTLGKDTKTGVFSLQLDELWFNSNVDLLRNSLGITPKDSTHPFVPSLAGDLVIYFVKGLPTQEIFIMSLRYYYKKYLEMAARKPSQPTTMTGEKVGKKMKALKA